MGLKILGGSSDQELPPIGFPKTSDLLLGCQTIMNGLCDYFKRGVKNREITSIMRGGGNKEGEKTNVLVLKGGEV